MTFFSCLATDAIIRAVLAGVSATLFVVATELILSSNLFVMFLVVAAVRSLAVLTTLINHVRMFNAVRAHRNQVQDVALSNQQRATILRREKKVAYHMMILIVASLIRLAPSLSIKAFQSSFIEQYRYLFPWTLSFAFINASVNPIINFWCNKELRNAIKALVPCWRHQQLAINKVYTMLWCYMSTNGQSK